MLGFNDWPEKLDTFTNQLKKSLITTKLLIKNNKKPITNSNFPSKLVILSKKFTATSTKVGYLGLKAPLDNNLVNYSKYRITQASKVKESS